MKWASQHRRICTKVGAQNPASRITFCSALGRFGWPGVGGRGHGTRGRRDWADRGAAGLRKDEVPAVANLYFPPFWPVPTFGSVAAFAGDDFGRNSDGSRPEIVGDVDLGYSRERDGRREYSQSRTEESLLFGPMPSDLPYLFATPPRVGRI